METKEAQCGILQFLSALPSIPHEIKFRYTDFVVNEIDQNGNVAPSQFTHYEHVKKAKPVQPEFEPVQVCTECKLKLEELLGSKICNEMMVYIEKINKGEIEKTSPFRVDIELNKEQRTAFHGIIRQFMPVFESTTEENEQKRMLIVLKSTLTKNQRKKLNFAQRGQTPEEPFTIFYLTKHNMDTLFAINILAKSLRKSEKCFSYAGTKDKRGVTTQRISCFLGKEEDFINSVGYKVI